MPIAMPTPLTSRGRRRVQSLPPPLVALLLVRLLCAFLPGYVHPDEFYQGGQELFLGRSGDGDGDGGNGICDDPLAPRSWGLWEWLLPSGPPTWEFDPSHALRSSAPLYFMTALPLGLYSAAKAALGRLVTGWAAPALGGREILLVPRIFLVLLSACLLDRPCRYLRAEIRGGRAEAGSAPRAPLVLASSWPILLLVGRPFTNGLEAMILAVLLALIAGDWAGGRSPATALPRSIAVGSLCAAGIFVRFTFAFFALPAVLMYLLGRGSPFMGGRGSGRADPLARGSALLHAATSALGFLAVAVPLVLVDTAFYGRMLRLSSLDLDWTTGASLPPPATVLGCYIAPLNALLYNSRVDNLGEHGLHPRITHAAVNLPMLFGPLAFWFYADVTRRARRGLLGLIRRRMAPTCVDEEASREGVPSAATMCRWVALSGFAVLSCAPHQEPRFLLPMAVPLAVLYGDRLVVPGGAGGRTCSWISWGLPWWWIGFNLALLAFFGGLHQAGVVPSLLAAPGVIAAANAQAPGSSDGSGSVLLYHRTYMPPTFLAQQFGTPEHGPLRVVDLGGAGEEDLRSAIEGHLKCRSPLGGTHRRVYLAAPASALVADDLPFSAHVVYTYWPHLTTEDLPAWGGSVGGLFRDMVVSIFEVQCGPF